MSEPRRVKGALGGSRLFEQPQYAGEIEAFERALAARPRVLLEIGFDHGRRLLETARRHPDWQVIGLEVRRRRVDEARERGAGLDNLLPWRADARTVLALHTPAAAVDIVEILFPTPWWHAGTRQKRLLVTPDLVADVARALKPGGLLWIETDVDDYSAAIAEALASEADLVVAPAEGRPPIEARSRRQWKCWKEDLPVHRFVRRRG